MKHIKDLFDRRNRETCEKILRTPPIESLEWRDVRALFSELGEIAWQPNGDLKVTCNGHEMLLHPSPTKDVEKVDERNELRGFLQRLDQSVLELQTV